MIARSSLLLEAMSISPKVRWKRPSLVEERDEIIERARDLRLHPAVLKDAIRRGQLAPLSREIWQRLQNTDSWKTLTTTQARALAVKYKKDANRVERGFRAGSTFAAPIVLHRAGKPPYLVAGNTRLMIARALRVVPLVIHARLP